jgi:outer membrane immunogenic protein
MIKLRTHLLATAAVAALGGSAYAADMGLPLKAPPPAPIPYTSWQGFYIGGLVGAGRLNETASPSSAKTGSGGADSGFIHSRNGVCGGGGYAAPGTCSTAATGAIAGVEIGYDWQDRYFVYGVAADWTWTGLKHTFNSTNTTGTTHYTHQAKVDWLASFRGRMGLAVDSTLVYFTGGLALGELKSSLQTIDDSGANPSWGQLSKVQVGWVAGLGVEHKFNQNWSIKAEALYYDLGRATATGDTKSGTTYTTEFTHEVIVGRVGLAYHF